MKIQGEYRFEVPVALVWPALLDPAVLARTLPGCERLERTGENTFAGVLTVAIGPVKGQFQGTLELSDLRPLEGYRMKVNGSGGAGFLKGEGDLGLRADGGATILSYDLEAQVGGKIAGVGQRLLESSSRVITRQGLEGLDRQLKAIAATVPEAAGAAAMSSSRPFGVEGQAAPPPPPAPSQAAMAAKFATGMVGELVPRRHRWWVALLMLLFVAGLAVVLVRACGSQ